MKHKQTLVKQTVARFINRHPNTLLANELKKANLPGQKEIIVIHGRVKGAVFNEVAKRFIVDDFVVGCRPGGGLASHWIALFRSGNSTI